MFSVDTGLLTLNYKTPVVLDIITVQLIVEFIFGGEQRANCDVFLKKEDKTFYAWTVAADGYYPGTNLHLIVWHMFSLLILSGKI